MVLGQYKTSITNGRRIAIPKAFRTSLGNNLIVARWYEGCLVLVSRESWEALLQKITSSNKIATLSVRDTDRFILASAFEINPDSQGRVVVPDKLSNYANLNSEVVFIGLLDRVEIWDSKLWEQKEKEVSDKAAELIEELAKNE